VEDLAEMADGATECGEVARGGCLFDRNFSATRSTVLAKEERKARPYVTLSLHQ
jgi:hypothetical protein